MKQIFTGTDGKHYVERKQDYRFDFSGSAIFAYGAAAFTFLSLVIFFSIF